MVMGDKNMAKIEQCPGFETFGADVKAAREKLGMSRRELAEKIGVDPRYLANIELKSTIPSMPLMVQLFHLCSLPAEKYFKGQYMSFFVSEIDGHSFVADINISVVFL